MLLAASQPGCDHSTPEVARMLKIILRYSSLEEVSQGLGVIENTKISGKKLGDVQKPRIPWAQFCFLPCSAAAVLSFLLLQGRGHMVF